ncbi:MAG: HAD-IA family hydrolase [Pirellulaceae bacterium]
MKRRPAILVFDAVGTLLRPREPVAVTYHRIGAQFGSCLTEDEIRRRFHLQRQIVFGNIPEQVSSESIERQHWRALVHAVFGELADGGALFDALWQFYAGPENWSVYPEVEGCLDQLMAGQFEMAIASNFDRRLHGICAGLPAIRGIGHVCCSSDVGFSKPDPRFFHAVWQQIRPNQGPTEFPLMIGDDWDKDVVAARAAGWQSAHLVRKESDLAQLLVELDLL